MKIKQIHNDTKEIANIYKEAQIPFFISYLFWFPYLAYRSLKQWIHLKKEKKI